MAPKAKKPKKGEVKQATINFIGGKYDGRSLGFVYPTPEWLVLSMGTELYRRMDPPGVVDAKYQFTDDWDEYQNKVGDKIRI